VPGRCVKGHRLLLETIVRLAGPNVSIADAAVELKFGRERNVDRQPDGTRRRAAKCERAVELIESSGEGGVRNRNRSDSSRTSLGRLLARNLELGVARERFNDCPVAREAKRVGGLSGPGRALSNRV